MKYLALAVGTVIVLAGCGGEPTIDASTEPAYEESMKKVVGDMDAARAQEFMGAVMQLSMAQIDLADPDQQPTDLMEVLHGKTAAEVIEMASQQRTLAEAERARREAETLRELATKASEEQAALAALSDITIEAPSVEQREGMFGVNTTINFTVTNGLDQAISRLYWENVVISPGRSVPWIQEDSNYSISGGLEPGETATWSLNPGGLRWNTTEFPEDAVLEVNVYRADGADGEPIHNARLLSDRERGQLDAMD